MKVVGELFKIKPTLAQMKGYKKKKKSVIIIKTAFDFSSQLCDLKILVLTWR